MSCFMSSTGLAIKLHNKQQVLLGIGGKTLVTYRVSQKKLGSQKNSNCSNSLNFEAKINCNTIKPNVQSGEKHAQG